jgi:hypothetical protein
MMPFLKLEKPIALPEGGHISTVGEALDFYFALPMHERIEEHWTETAKLLVSTFDENSGDVLRQAERQFRLALGRHVTMMERQRRLGPAA